MIENMKDYYRILDIPFNADTKEIEKAYQRLKTLITKNSVSLYSILPSSEKDTFLTDIEEAYRTLSDPYKRSNYDLFLKGENVSTTSDRNSDFAKQLSFGFAREAFTYLDYTRKSEQIYNETIRRINNDYLIRSEGISIKIIEEENIKEEEEKTESQNVIQEVNIPATLSVQEEEKRPTKEVEEIPRPVEKEVTEEVVSNTEENVRIDEPTTITNINTEPVKSEDINTESAKSDEKNTTPPIVVDENSEFSGSFLRQIRESMGISIKDIAQTTKISISNIRYLEDEDYQNLPALVYIKGYLAQIAKCLNLRPDLVVRSYIARMNEIMEKKGR